MGSEIPNEGEWTAIAVPKDKRGPYVSIRLQGKTSITNVAEIKLLRTCGGGKPPTCVPGGISKKDASDPDNQAACNGLQQDLCQSSPDCTYHSSCTASVPLSGYPESKELFALFPSLVGKTFTCSCDETLQLIQVQQFWGTYLAAWLPPTTSTCQATAAYKPPSYVSNVFETFCKGLSRRQDCLSTPWCEDAHIDPRHAMAKKMVEGLLECTRCKCATCGTSGTGSEEFLDAGVGYQHCVSCQEMGAWGGRRRLR